MSVAARRQSSGEVGTIGQGAAGPEGLLDQPQFQVVAVGLGQTAIVV